MNEVRHKSIKLKNETACPDPRSMKTIKSRIAVVLFTVFLFLSYTSAYEGMGGKSLLHAPFMMNRLLQKSVGGSAMVAIMVASGSATASSGGGLDYANANLKDQGIIIE